MEVNGIEVIYNHVILVLKGVSLQVPQREHRGPAGRRWRGQDHHAARHLQPAQGRARRGHQRAASRWRAKQFENLSPADLVKRGVVQVMEGRHCFAHLTIEENLLTGSYTRTSKGEIAANLEKVYNYFPRLKTRRTSQAAYTSGGEQQMCAIGRALMSQPQHGAAGRAFHGPGAADRGRGVQHRAKTSTPRRRSPSCWPSRTPTWRSKYADYGYIMESGRIVMDGAANDLASNEDVKEFYLGVGGGERKSFKDVKSYKRRKRWLGLKVPLRLHFMTPSSRGTP